MWEGFEARKEIEAIKENLIAIVLLVIGFVLLIKGADFFVEGSSSVAKMLKVPSLIIGLTIVAMGTSLPECAVSITASLTNNNALAVSNVVGSNIFNLMAVCGFCAWFCPLLVDKSTLKKEFPFSGVCAVLLMVLGYMGMELGRADGILLLGLFVGFLVWMIHSARKARAGAAGETEDDEYQILPVWRCIVYIVGGIIAIRFGGDFVVDGASAIAAKMGLSQNLIGLTVVALGTSLPELVTSVVAARKNELDMALGNVIGSNIFNILLVLGIAAAISPVAFIMENVIDIAILLLMSAMVWVFAWTKQRIDKKEGIIMLLLYAAYLAYICMR
jgi:cation:H+ antiporter